VTTDSIKAAYQRSLQEHFAVRRYTGSGANRPYFDTGCRGSVSGYTPEELVGTIQQSDLRRKRRCVSTVSGHGIR